MKRFLIGASSQAPEIAQLFRNIRINAIPVWDMINPKPIVNFRMKMMHAPV